MSRRVSIENYPLLTPVTESVVQSKLNQQTGRRFLSQLFFRIVYGGGIVDSTNRDIAHHAAVVDAVKTIHPKPAELIKPDGIGNHFHVDLPVTRPVIDGGHTGGGESNAMPQQQANAINEITFEPQASQRPHRVQSQ